VPAEMHVHITLSACLFAFQRRTGNDIANRVKALLAKHFLFGKLQGGIPAMPAERLAGVRTLYELRGS
jgi:hypothetical protein